MPRRGVGAARLSRGPAFQIDSYEKLYEEVSKCENAKVFNGWLQCDCRPFKQALLNIIKRWGFMFKRHLSEHVVNRWAPGPRSPSPATLQRAASLESRTDRLPWCGWALLRATGRLEVRLRGQWAPSKGWGWGSQRKGVTGCEGTPCASFDTCLLSTHGLRPGGWGRAGRSVTRGPAPRDQRRQSGP